MNKFKEYTEKNTEQVLVNKGLFCSMVASMLAVAVEQDASEDELVCLFNQCLAGQSVETRSKVKEIILDLVNNASRYMEEDDE